MAEAEKQEHVRGEKIPTYLAAIGGLNAGLWGLAVAVSFPVLTFFVAVGVAAASAFSEGARQKLKKIGDQIKNFGRDLKSHVREDLNRVTHWWSNRQERKTAEKAASIEHAAAAFRNAPGLGNNPGTPQFNVAAAPVVGVTPLVVAPIADAPKVAPVAPQNPTL